MVRCFLSHWEGCPFSNDIGGAIYQWLTYVGRAVPSQTDGLHGARLRVLTLVVGEFCVTGEQVRWWVGCHGTVKKNKTRVLIWPYCERTGKSEHGSIFVHKPEISANRAMRILGTSVPRSS